MSWTRALLFKSPSLQSPFSLTTSSCPACSKADSTSCFITASNLTLHQVARANFTCKIHVEKMIMAFLFHWERSGPDCGSTMLGGPLYKCQRTPWQCWAP
ncbi:hypothetical protein BDR07DRAFT_471645 [Suillus spraguei]|nr:hypothetical protein BDR07DRAFT_471645 [Suillus spraguei]